MVSLQEKLKLAKLTWRHPKTDEVHEHVLLEGATATVGRSSNNDIVIPNQHVSRQHSVITYRDGVFMISDLNSANGTYVNDIEINEPFPLASGDVIRLYAPTMVFSAVVTEEDTARARETGKLITAAFSTGRGQLIITNGPQESQTIPLLIKEVTIGRATSNATWEVGLQDPSVSRPHARLRWVEDCWMLYDLGSSNGTFINNIPVTETGWELQDGDAINFGATMVLYRAG